MGRALLLVRRCFFVWFFPQVHGAELQQPAVWKHHWHASDEHLQLAIAVVRALGANSSGCFSCSVRRNVAANSSGCFSCSVRRNVAVTIAAVIGLRCWLLQLFNDSRAWFQPKPLSRTPRHASDVHDCANEPDVSASLSVGSITSWIAVTKIGIAIASATGSAGYVMPLSRQRCRTATHTSHTTSPVRSSPSATQPLSLSNTVDEKWIILVPFDHFASQRPSDALPWLVR